MGASDQVHLDIFERLGYTCNPVNGQYVWVGTPPAGGIISAVEALPTTPNMLYSLDPLTDSDCLALQAVTTPTQWTLFRIWLAKQKIRACTAVFVNHDTLLWRFIRNVLESSTQAGVISDLNQSLSDNDINDTVG